MYAACTSKVMANVDFLFAKCSLTLLLSGSILFLSLTLLCNKQCLSYCQHYSELQPGVDCTTPLPVGSSRAWRQGETQLQSEIIHVRTYDMYGHNHAFSSSHPFSPLHTHTHTTFERLASITSAISLMWSTKKSLSVCSLQERRRVRHTLSQAALLASGG